MVRKIRQGLKSILSGTIALILGNAAFKRYLVAGISKFPRLEALLRRVLVVIRGTPGQDGISNLSPHARRIHAELIAAIWRHHNNKEHA